MGDVVLSHLFVTFFDTTIVQLYDCNVRKTKSLHAKWNMLLVRLKALPAYIVQLNLNARSRTVIEDTNAVE